MSIRDRVAAAADCETITRPVPEWDDPETGEKTILELRQFDLDSRIRYSNATTKAEGDEMATAIVFAEMVIHAAFDPETGEPAFTASDVAMLRRKNGATMNELAYEILQLNRMIDDAVDEGKDDSSETRSDGDSSDSLPDLA